MENNFKKNRKKGFSLVEVMMVVFILSTTLTVFIQVISKSIDHSMESRDSIIAADLVQEGVELVKNIRDNNWVNKLTPFSGIDNGSYVIDYDSSLRSFGSYVLKFDGNFYNISNGDDTKFSRKIEITGDADTKIITAYVIWERSDFPAGCSVSNKCVYAAITMTKWGGE